ncbi:hypothetical protein GCM10007937_06100 [Mesorhizobium albiziae]|nr:hypothetical protein GCM10007937_06100 [Mesorhizobium albiziae]
MPVARTIANKRVAPNNTKNSPAGNCAATEETDKPASWDPTAYDATIAISPALTAVADPQVNAATRIKNARKDMDILIYLELKAPA